jgi:ribosomal protein S18 acetylase RimI-like enzyme
VRVMRLEKDQLPAFHAIRLRGFRDSPEAFGSSFEEEALLTAEQVSARYTAVTNPDEDHFVLGAFDDAGMLIGVAGFYREGRLKMRHKGVVWGMYVLPESRRTGVARALLTEIIAKARELPDLRQVGLAVSSRNDAAKRLYQSLEFVPYGVEPDALKVGDRFYDEDLMVMQIKPQKCPS